jgi:6-phosphogluconolactonase (cycloisomerase 2 family)
MKTRVLIPIVILALLLASSPAAARSAAVSRGSFSLASEYRDVNAGGPIDLAFSPDGKNLYAACYSDNSIAVYSRDSLTGKLSLIEVQQNSGYGLGGVVSIAVSPDGRNVYAAGKTDDALAVFDRDPATGNLVFHEAVRDGVFGVDGLGGILSVAVSPDGKQVFAASHDDNAVVVFNRDPSSGALDLMVMRWHIEPALAGMDGPTALAVSPDGRQIYVTAFNGSITQFQRDPLIGSGSFGFGATYMDSDPGMDGLNAAFDVAVSPDGSALYTAGMGDDAVGVFSRAADTGALTFVEVQKNGTGGASGLQAVMGVSLSADGKYVFAASVKEGALVVFGRNSANGTLTFLANVKEGSAGFSGLGAILMTVSSPDSQQFYAAGGPRSDIIVFSMGADGSTPSHIENQWSAFGLGGTGGSTVSPDGKNLYITGNNDDVLAIFQRNKSLGSLAYLHAMTNTEGSAAGLNGARAVVITPDGQNVYVAGADDDALVIFRRSEPMGFLAFTDVKSDPILDGIQALAISPDGLYIYTAGALSDTIAVGRIDLSTGDLSMVETETDGVGGVDGLDGAYALAISPDGAFLYAAGYYDDAIAIFSRDIPSGQITYTGLVKDEVGSIHFLDGVGSIAISPDGKNLYAASRNDDALNMFSRNPTSGALALMDAIGDSPASGDGLDGARAVAASPDGTYVAVASQFDNTLVIFKRDPADGALKFAQVFRDGVDSQMLSVADALSISPDSNSIYVSGYGDNGVAVFQRAGAIFLPVAMR